MSLKLHKLIRQAAVWVTVLVICFSTVTKPFFAQPAEAAYHQTYIQTTIDVSNWNILARWEASRMTSKLPWNCSASGQVP